MGTFHNSEDWSKVLKRDLMFIDKLDILIVEKML